MNKKTILFFAVGIVLILLSSALAGYNTYVSYSAGKNAVKTADILLSSFEIQNENGNDSEKDKVGIVRPVNANSEKETMPVRNINGDGYIAVIVIPSLNLTLPVCAEFSYEQLKNAPCRYCGSVYDDNLVICGHNYTSQFGVLDRLKQNDKVFLYDTKGNEYSYTVTETELLSESDTELMITGDWDLTLYTCTLGASQRITVRCEKCG